LSVADVNAIRFLIGRVPDYVERSAWIGAFETGSSLGTRAKTALPVVVSMLAGDEVLQEFAADSEELAEQWSPACEPNSPGRRA
jgi:hypothetical protein